MHIANSMLNKKVDLRRLKCTASHREFITRALEGKQIIPFANARNTLRGANNWLVFLGGNCSMVKIKACDQYFKTYMRFLW